MGRGIPSAVRDFYCEDQLHSLKNSPVATLNSTILCSSQHSSTTISAMKWVGSVVPAPHGSRFRSSGGREKHYGAVELSEAGQQIYVNDVVEILPLKLEWDQEQRQQKQQKQHLGNFTEMGQPRLAQVCGNSIGLRLRKVHESGRITPTPFIIRVAVFLER